MEEDFLPLRVEKLSVITGNIYKAVRITGARSNQLTVDLKEELSRKLAEFAPAHDNLEEIIENREQIEISRYYERKPKPTQNALRLMLTDEIYWRNANNPLDSSSPELAPDA